MATADDKTAPRRRGRRSGGADTRALLLEAGRKEFADRGYDNATVRAIAARAGVDPAMIKHWFGGKEGLFVAAVRSLLDPSTIFAEALPGDCEHLAERILITLLQVWDSTRADAMSALFQSTASHGPAARMLREFISHTLVTQLVTRVSPNLYELRGCLISSQLLGLVVVRYTLKIEPLASADHATIIAAEAPALRHYLTGKFY